MFLTLLERELLFTLRAYLTGEMSLDDVRQWEVSVSDSSEVTLDEAAIIEKVALLAETTVARAMDEEAFREAVRDIEQRLGADAAPALTTTGTPLVGAQTGSVMWSVWTARAEQASPMFRVADRSPEEVSV